MVHDWRLLLYKDHWLETSLSSNASCSPIHLSFDSDDSGDEFLRKFDEEVAKQKVEKK